MLKRIVAVVTSEEKLQSTISRSAKIADSVCQSGANAIIALRTGTPFVFWIQNEFIHSVQFTSQTSRIRRYAFCSVARRRRFHDPVRMNIAMLFLPRRSSNGLLVIFHAHTRLNCEPERIWNSSSPCTLRQLIDKFDLRSHRVNILRERSNNDNNIRKSLLRGKEGEHTRNFDWRNTV